MLSAIVVPMDVVPSLMSSTVLFTSAVPVKTGVVTLVILSVSDSPVSEASVKSGSDGANGGTVSTVTANTNDVTLVFPAVSVAVAVKL